RVLRSPGNRQLLKGKKLAACILIAGASLIFLVQAQSRRIAQTTTIPAGSVPSFAGNAQHTAIYQPTARNLNQILWSTTIDFNNSGSAAHYGAPLITAANTLL